MKGAYYNEIEPFAAQWIRNLISAGLVAPGDVDERSIEDVRSDDLRGYTQCHFFAGIAVWSHALRRAGWPDDRPVWTGSCPCQPFSAAGKGGGFADERHLWPAWHHLIRECRPQHVFGEQVADKNGLMWLDLVQADLEAENYACAPVDICAAGFGAPHRRQRLFFVANRQLAHHHYSGLEGRRVDGLGRSAERSVGTRGMAGELAVSDDAEWGSDAPGGDICDGDDARREEGSGDAEGCGGSCGLDHHHHVRRHRCEAQSGEDGRRESEDSVGPSVMADAGQSDVQRRGRPGETLREVGTSESEAPKRKWSGFDIGTGDTTGLLADADGGNAGSERIQRSQKHRQQQEDGILGVVHGTRPTDGFWRSADWVLCRDPDGPKWRPVEPGTFPLVDGAPARVGKLRAYGNAIVAEVATTFIEAYLEHEAERLIDGLI